MTASAYDADVDVDVLLEYLGLEYLGIKGPMYLVKFHKKKKDIRSFPSSPLL